MSASRRAFTPSSAAPRCATLPSSIHLSRVRRACGLWRLEVNTEAAKTAQESIQITIFADPLEPHTCPRCVSHLFQKGRREHGCSGVFSRARELVANRSRLTCFPLLRTRSGKLASRPQLEHGCTRNPGLRVCLRLSPCNHINLQRPDFRHPCVFVKAHLQQLCSPAAHVAAFVEPMRFAAVT